MQSPNLIKFGTHEQQDILRIHDKFHQCLMLGGAITEEKSKIFKLSYSNASITTVSEGSVLQK